MTGGNMRKCAAEAIGTFWLTFAGCGSAVITAGFPQIGIGLPGVALAFGLTVLTMAYAIGQNRQRFDLWPRLRAACPNNMRHFGPTSTWVEPSHGDSRLRTQRWQRTAMWLELRQPNGA
jgi:Major intrinsic protein